MDEVVSAKELKGGYIQIKTTCSIDRTETVKVSTLITSKIFVRSLSLYINSEWSVIPLR